MTTRTRKIELATEKFSAVEFSNGYVCIDDQTYSGADDWAAFADKFPDAKRAGAIGFDEECEHYYALAFADCMDPPVGIVRADSLEEAIDKFVDAWPGNRLSEEEAAGIVHDEKTGEATCDDAPVRMTDDGWWYYSESLNMSEVTIVRAHA